MAKFKEYTDIEKEGAFTEWVKNNNFLETARVTGIADKTLRRWAKEDNWTAKIDKARVELRKVLGEKGLLDLITTEEEWLKVSRIIFGLTMRTIRPRQATEEGGEALPPEVVPRSIPEVIHSLKFVRELQDRAIGTVPTEEIPQITDEQADAIYKILLGDRDYDADDERRHKAEEFKNRQAQTPQE